MFTGDIKWKDWIESTVWSDAMKFGYICRSRQLLSIEPILQIYKSNTLPCIEYCSYIWPGASLMNLEILTKRDFNIISSNLQ